MELVARSLSKQEREGLGRYYASLRAASTARPALGGNLERGRQLVLEGDWSIGVPSCTSCHGPSAFGVAPGFPGLAAQHPSYTASQLAAWVRSAESRVGKRCVSTFRSRCSPSQ